jgi:hypothetical protein
MISPDLQLLSRNQVAGFGLSAIPQSAATSSRSTPKRCRVDTEKLQKAVAKEFAAKRDKKTVKSKARKTAACVDPFLMFGGVLVCTPPLLLE